MIPDPSPPISGKMPNFIEHLLMGSSLIDCDQYIDHVRYVDCDRYVIHNWYVDRNHYVDHAHYVNSNHYVDHDRYVDYNCYVDHDHYKVSKLGFMKMKSKMTNTVLESKVPLFYHSYENAFTFCYWLLVGMLWMCKVSGFH